MFLAYGVVATGCLPISVWNSNIGPYLISRSF